MGKNPHSIVEYRGERRSGRCGYCKNNFLKFTHGMWAHSLNVEDYQELIDRGWRRSGKYCYKPNMKVTCCPQYEIRCNANDFKFSKSKKKVAKKMQQFIINGDQSDIENWKKRCLNRPQTTDVKENDVTMKDLQESKSVSHDAVVAESSSSSASCDTETEKRPSEPCVSEDEGQRSPKPTKTSNPPICQIQRGAGPDPNKPPCRKAKEIRKERKLRKLKEAGNTVTKPSSAKNPESLTLKAILPHLTRPSNSNHLLEVRLVRPGDPEQEFENTKKESLELYQKYQCTIHDDELDDCTESQWKRFLVDSPLNYDSSGPGPGFGTFHNQYWLDDKLIAVGVVDILPSCISSVYLYYDPDYGFLSLGVYSALSEIQLVRQLQADLPSLEYYFMGYYIHSCPKMRYKGAYDPSELLCPETYEWVPLSKCISTLDKQRYARLNVLNGGSADAVDPNAVMHSLDAVLCLWQRSIVRYGVYKVHKYPMDSDKKQQKEDEEITEYVSFVGKNCATRMLLYRS